MSDEGRGTIQEGRKDRGRGVEKAMGRMED